MDSAALSSRAGLIKANHVVDTARPYRYVGPNPELYGRPCYGCRHVVKGRRIWGGGPGPRNALVWFPHIYPGGFVVVHGRSCLVKEATWQKKKP